jgi:1-acyl-sn-glycerol-3-phosphate acyltransferase
MNRYRELYTHWPADPLGRRDPDFIRREMGWIGELLDLWFAPETTGLEHVPDGPALVVGMHNGGNLAPDMFATMVAFWRRFGPDRAAYGLAHDVVFKMPLAGRWIQRLGAVPAHRENAAELLHRGATVLVYPGGDLDAFKPWRERHLVKFGERSGFIRTALEARVPIVPVVSVGAHETFAILSDGRGAAKLLGLKRWTRLEVLPIILCLPWGVWIGSVESHIPVPSKVRIRVLPPIHLDGAPDDEAYVRGAREEVRLTMQAAVDEMVREGNFGPLARFTGGIAPPPPHPV